MLIFIWKKTTFSVWSDMGKHIIGLSTLVNKLLLIPKLKSCNGSTHSP